MAAWSSLGSRLGKVGKDSEGGLSLGYLSLCDIFDVKNI